MIAQLRIHHVRNLGEGQKLDLGARNVFVGANGSGKTSVLEAVYLLSRGKSFRHHEPKRYIGHGQDAATVWAKLANGTRLALRKDKNANADLRLNDKTARKQSDLAKALPALLVDPSGVAALENGSDGRRSLLDWLCFHSDEAFFGAWLDYQRLLKQRNSLLKNPNARRYAAQIFAWDRALSEKADALHRCRERIFAQWIVHFEQAARRLLPAYANAFCLSYHSGFGGGDLASALRQRLDRDIELGYTRLGAHRADLGLHLDDGAKKQPALHVLSRGEKKLLLFALKLAQLRFVADQNGASPLALVDDLGAELDKDAQNALLEALLSLPCQIFVTCLDDAVAQKIHAADPALARRFRLKNGAICPL